MTSGQEESLHSSESRHKVPNTQNCPQDKDKEANQFERSRATAAGGINFTFSAWASRVSTFEITGTFPLK